MSSLKDLLKQNASKAAPDLVDTPPAELEDSIVAASQAHVEKELRKPGYYKTRPVTLIDPQGIIIVPDSEGCITSSNKDTVALLDYWVTKSILEKVS